MFKNPEIKFWNVMSNLFVISKCYISSCYFLVFMISLYISFLHCYFINGSVLDTNSAKSIIWLRQCAVILGQIHGFNILSIGGIQIVYNFIRPLATKLCVQ